MPYQHVRPTRVVALSPTKAATAVGIRQERIAAAIRSGELRIHRIGTKTRITMRALWDWIQKIKARRTDAPNRQISVER
jgi:excisionase family DNA binding protein